MALMLLHIIFSVSIVAQKYYGFVAACRCKEHEIKHICRYHGRQAGEREVESSEGGVSRCLVFVLIKGYSFPPMGQLLPS